ncbi:hypothetical protein M3J09_003818 [Ascochyta lentis]
MASHHTEAHNTELFLSCSSSWISNPLQACSIFQASNFCRKNSELTDHDSVRKITTGFETLDIRDETLLARADGIS